MPDLRITELPPDVTVLLEALVAIVNNPSAGTPVTSKMTVANLTAFLVDLANTQTIAGLKTFTKPLFLTEVAAALADVAGDGQFAVFNETPNIPVFISDTGVEQIIDPSVSEIVGKTANYTFALADKGKTVRFTGSTGSQTFTIDANATVAFKIGTFIGLQNDGTVAISIAITTDTLTFAKDNTTGTRVLAAGGIAIVQKVAATKWKIHGSLLLT